MAPEQLAEELHADERVQHLLRLENALENRKSDKDKQRFFNIIMVIALIVGGYVVWANRQSLNILKDATGPEAQAASAAVIQDIKCDNREALGEALASLGIPPPPLKDGCPPYTVIVKPQDGQPSQPATAQPQAAAPANSQGGTVVVLVPATSSQPSPNQQQPSTPEDTEPRQPPPTSSPTTEPPKEEEPPVEKPDTCALGVALFGCVVTASAPAATNSASGLAGGLVSGLL